MAKYRNVGPDVVIGLHPDDEDRANVVDLHFITNSSQGSGPDLSRVVWEDGEMCVINDEGFVRVDALAPVQPLDSNPQFWPPESTIASWRDVGFSNYHVQRRKRLSWKWRLAIELFLIACLLLAIYTGTKLG